MITRSLSHFILGIIAGVLMSLLVYATFLRDSSSAIDNSARILKLGHALDVSHPVHQAMLQLQQRVKELSSGKMMVEIYPGGVLGSEVESIEQLQKGVLAMTKTSAAAMESFVDEMKVFGMPYLFRDKAHFWNVLESPLGKSLLTKSESKRLRGLCYYDSGSRNFYSNKKMIKTPDDLKGMKIRVMNSRVAIDMIETMGGAPTPISWGEVYSALAQGIVDGAENNPPSYVSNKHYEVGQYFSLDGHTRIPDILMISTIIWDALSLQEQAWLQQAADESSVFQRELWDKKTELALEEARSQGAEVYQPDTTLFSEKVQPMYEKLDDPKLKLLIQQIQAQ